MLTATKILVELIKMEILVIWESAIWLSSGDRIHIGVGREREGGWKIKSVGEDNFFKKLGCEG